MMILSNILQSNQLSLERKAKSSLPTRKGSWTQEEDNLLRKCIEKYGEGKWHRVPHRAGLNRCRKSCRLRWLNYLKPNIKRGSFDLDEIDLIMRLHKLLGNRWSLIAGRLPGRTANDVKNFWNTRLKKKISEEGIILQKAECSTHFLRNSSHKSPKITTSNTIIKPRPRILSKNYSTRLSDNGLRKNTTGISADDDDQPQNPCSSNCNTDAFVQKSVLMSNQDEIQWLENIFNAKEVSEGLYWPLCSSNFEDEILEMGADLWGETWGGGNKGGNDNIPNDFSNFCI